MNKDKRTNLQEAVGHFLNDGDILCLGGIGARDPLAGVYEIIRQKKRELTLVAESQLDCGCMMLGAGCIKKLETSYCGIGVIGTGINYRRSVEKGIPNKIEVEEYSNYSASLRFLAGAMDVPFLPTRSLLGSDIPKYNKNIKIIDDPYGGDQIALVPASKPDVAIVHVQRSDIMGNCQIWGVTNNDMNIPRAAKKTIITCEEIVPTSEIRKNPNMTVIPHYCVDAVVQVPFGSHPMFVSGYYWVDTPFRREFIRQNSTQEGFDKWAEEWIFGVDNFDQYLRKLGKDRLNKLAKMEKDNYTINF